jgi:hypothetical protein
MQRGHPLHAMVIIMSWVIIKQHADIMTDSNDVDDE